MGGGAAAAGGMGATDPLASLNAQPALPAPTSFASTGMGSPAPQSNFPTLGSGGGMGGMGDMGGMGGGPLGGMSMPSPLQPPQQRNPMSSILPLMMMMGGDMKMRHLMMMNMMGGGGMMGGGMSPFLLMNMFANA